MVLVRTNNNKIRSKRRSVGTFIAELPLILWVIFIGIGRPLLSLVLTTVCYGMFVQAAKQAADVACSIGEGTIRKAQQTAVAVASVFPGVTVSPDNVQCFIVARTLSTRRYWTVKKVSIS